VVEEWFGRRFRKEEGLRTETEEEMECVLSGNQIKSLNRAVNCLYRVGSELLIEVLPDKVSLRAQLAHFEFWQRLFLRVSLGASRVRAEILPWIAVVAAHAQHRMVGLSIGDFQGPILRRISCARTECSLQRFAEGDIT
jgi:hypothetical protein